MLGLLIPGWLKRAAMALAGLVLAGLGLFAAGRRTGKAESAAKAAERKAKDADRIGKALADRADSDPDAARERLRKFAKRKR